jgi:DNA-binding Xre family transcriptional regulator
VPLWVEYCLNLAKCRSGWSDNWPMLDGDTISRDGKAIGERIRKLRVERGLSNLQLAERLGLSVPAVKKIQHGSACIQFLKLAEICKALETEPNHLLGYADSGAARLRAVLETVLETVGVPQSKIGELVDVSMQAIFEDGTQPSNVDPLQAARVQVYLAARRAVGTSQT